MFYTHKKVLKNAKISRSCWLVYLEYQSTYCELVFLLKYTFSQKSFIFVPETTLQFSAKKDVKRGSFAFSSIVLFISSLTSFFNDVQTKKCCSRCFIQNICLHKKICQIFTKCKTSWNIIKNIPSKVSHKVLTKKHFSKH